MKGDEFFDVQFGVIYIVGWNIGDCVCGGDEFLIKEEIVFVEEKVGFFSIYFMIFFNNIIIIL